MRRDQECTRVLLILELKGLSLIFEAARLFHKAFQEFADVARPEI
jgi:hypothetical protein